MAIPADFRSVTKKKWKVFFHAAFYKIIKLESLSNDHDDDGGENVS